MRRQANTRRALTTEVPVIREESSAPHRPSPAEDAPHGTPHGCYRGLVFIGHLVEDESGEEVEIVEAVACRRCGATS